MAPPKPTAAFSEPAQAISIRLGQSVALTWTSNYASSCTASASTAIASFSGSQPGSGTVLIAPTATGTVSFGLTCQGTGGSVDATSPMVTVGPSILSQLSTITTIGSTLDPIEHGGNPYGLSIAPTTAGLMTAGDLVICNFNDGASNTQGAGTTIVGLHPTVGSAPYRVAQSANLKGCNALAILSDGSVAATAFNAGLTPLVATDGTVNNPFATDAFAGPWGAAFAPAASAMMSAPGYGAVPAGMSKDMSMSSGSASAALYISNAGGGTIDRITLNGDAQTQFTEILKGFCFSGAPGAIYAPSGLTYDASIDTLYVVDTRSNSVIALSNVSMIGADGVVVDGQCGAKAPTPVPTFTGASASSAKVIATGGALNAPISAALLADGDLVVANGDLNSPATPNLLFEISPALGFVGAPVQLDTSGTAGALFGLAIAVDGSGNQLIYFNDDNTNTVNLLSK